MSDATENPASTTQDRRFHVVLIEDLGTAGRLARLTTIDTDSFSDVLREAAPQLAIAMPNPLNAAETWEFPLAFASLKDFEPGPLLEQVPAARARLRLREKIHGRRKGSVSESELDQALQTAAGSDPSLTWLTSSNDAGTAASPEAASASGGGSILDLVDEPTESRKVEADIERLAAQASDPERRVSAGQVSQLDATLKRLELELATVANALYKQGDVQRLEAAWRGVKFLVDRLDFRGGARLAILDTPRDGLVDAFLDHVIDPVFEGQLPTPNMVVANFACENNPQDIAMLDTLAQHAAGVPVPVVFPLTAAFFNVKSVPLVKNLPNLAGLCDGWQFAKWKTLRDQRHARALVPVLGRIVLRPLHERVDGRDEFTFAETVSKMSEVLWAPGTYAMPICAARSFANHRWPTRMFGSEAGKLDNLPIVANPNDASRPWGPGDATLPDAKIPELHDVGINLVRAQRDADACTLLGGVSAGRPIVTPERGKQDATLEVSLPYQLFANIASDWIVAQQPQLAGLGAPEIQQRLLGGIQLLLGLTSEEAAESAMVGVGDDPQHGTVVQVRMTPPPTIVPGGLHIDFNFAVPQ